MGPFQTVLIYQNLPRPNLQDSAKEGDLTFGRTARYVSKERLGLMLDHEYNLLLERLRDARGDRSEFFVFSDTVAAKSFKGTNEAHGWMGVRFEATPNSPPSDIILHVRMLDKENILEQQALGIIGVNLVYGAFYYIDDQDRFIQSLADNLGVDRIEADMINFSGALFSSVDNRLMSLKLVEYGLTNAVMFSPKGEVLQPSEVLHRKAIVVERGSFRPVTLVNVPGGQQVVHRDLHQNNHIHTFECRFLKKLGQCASHHIFVYEGDRPKTAALDDDCFSMKNL